jgi:hypothetical protein
MPRAFRRRSSASLVISIVALVLAASGSAMAASKLTSGNSLIREHSLSGNRLENHTLTGTQIDLSKLGKVPSAATADSATTAGTATTAGSAPISNVTYITATSAVPAENQSADLVTATCSPGTTVIGGGADVVDENDVFLSDSFPNDMSGWSADFFNNGTTPITVRVTAICAPAAATAS